MEKGDIIKGNIKDEKATHPIVFLERVDDTSFHGAILTKDKGKGNIAMEQEHFCINDENGNDYEFQYINNGEKCSSLVFNVYCKEQQWISEREIIGKLTPLGIEFVEEKLRGVDPIYSPIPVWDENRPE